MWDWIVSNFNKGPWICGSTYHWIKWNGVNCKQKEALRVQSFVKAASGSHEIVSFGTICLFHNPHFYLLILQLLKFCGNSWIRRVIQFTTTIDQFSASEIYHLKKFTKDLSTTSRAVSRMCRVTTIPQQSNSFKKFFYPCHDADHYQNLITWGRMHDTVLS